MVRVFFIFILAVTSPLTMAQWYQTQGSAVVLNGDKASARSAAMENALKKALLVAGASVSSVQQVVNGLLTQDELNIRASGTVNSIELIEESYVDNSINVTIRVDVFPQEQQCFAADFKKSMLVTRAHLLHREQANIGQIYDIDQQLVSKFAQKLNDKSQYIDIKLANKASVPFSRYNKSFQTEQIKRLTMELGQRFDSQFILFTEIADVSFDNQVLNSWSFWQEDSFERHFDVNFYIYSTSTGELLSEKQYKNKAQWQFGKRERVDFNSQTFWQSAYGQMLDRTLENAILDFDESMMCEQTRARIVKVAGNEIIVGVGKKQGVKIGDEFTLLHSNTFKSDNGKTYAGFNLSPYKVKVSEVFLDSAVAITPDKGLLGNIQINDLAIKD